MPDGSLYTTAAYVITALALAGYAGSLLHRMRRVGRRIREGPGRPEWSTTEGRGPTSGEGDDWMVADSPGDVREVGRV